MHFSNAIIKPAGTVTNVVFDNEERNRLYWHSRRGMLELDLLLVPFATQHLQALDAAQLQQYHELLRHEDQDLFLWLTRREAAPNRELQGIVDLVLACNEARG